MRKKREPDSAGDYWVLTSDEDSARAIKTVFPDVSVHYLSNDRGFMLPKGITTEYVLREDDIHGGAL